jgi:hypothetical protein
LWRELFTQAFFLTGQTLKPPLNRHYTGGLNGSPYTDLLIAYKWDDLSDHPASLSLASQTRASSIFF